MTEQDYLPQNSRRFVVEGGANVGFRLFQTLRPMLIESQLLLEVQRRLNRIITQELIDHLHKPVVELTR
jgi:hypothetical protein